MRLRIAVGQIASESNHFVSTPCELDFFRKTGYLVEREELFTLARGDNEVAGMLAMLRQAGDVEIIPLLAARANASGPLSATCYDTLKERLLAPLRVAGPVEGVLLSHHGSMAAVREDDPEGDIASAVRAMVGPTVPLVMTLDLHGNVTRRMTAMSPGAWWRIRMPSWATNTIPMMTCTAPACGALRCCCGLRGGKSDR